MGVDGWSPFPREHAQVLVDFYVDFWLIFYVRCMSNNFTITMFWQGWHSSFNHWIVRSSYLYNNIIISFIDSIFVYPNGREEDQVMISYLFIHSFIQIIGSSPSGPSSSSQLYGIAWSGFWWPGPSSTPPSSYWRSLESSFTLFYVLNIH